MSNQLLDTQIEYLKGVGPQRAETLKKELRLHRFGDLLMYFPFRYVDKSKFYTIAELRGDMPYVQLKGKIGHLEKVGAKKGQRLVGRLHDETGTLELVWFKGVNYVSKNILPGKEYVVFGKPNNFNGKLNIVHPDVEDAAKVKTAIKGSLQAVYPSTEKLTAKGLHSKGIAKLVQALMQQAFGHIPEVLSRGIIEKHKLLSRNDAFRHIHFPESAAMLTRAMFRLKFEELFYLQLHLLRNKLAKERKVQGFVFGTVGAHFNQFYAEKLPFELTGAQKRVIKEIRKDMGSGRQMNRLLQGDVGSGKTMVALMTLLIAIDNGFQGALMAPTEILATQHYESIYELLRGTGVNVALLTGSTKAAQRRTLHKHLRDGDLHILIGTHALIEDAVQFKNLGMVVIDEQHRFGVAQRARLWKKAIGRPPHMLVMTATPIPRTLAMTFYGDLDVSVIDELPPGRKPVTTSHRTDAARLKVFGFMRDEIKKGRQIYVVYPLIQESEKLDYKDLEDGYESMCRAFPEYNVSIVHGKMKADAKEFEMQRFVKGETEIMVATTVIEVGVNVPNASVMVIESAERFGLSQLHQLRGRVGRGAEQSYCILMTSNKLSAETQKRMETMVASTDGFFISEVDLELRGPGDIMGTQQSGQLDLKIADLAADGQIMALARKQALEILETDPNFHQPENGIVGKHYAATASKKMNWSRIS